MNEPTWIRLEECLAVHEMLISRFGGTQGIRNKAVLISALDRPKNRFHHEAATIPELAASLAYGIIQNHPFLDGNKRTGFVCAVMFIESNGYTFNADQISVVQYTLGLAASQITEVQYSEFLESHSSKLTQ